MRIFNCGKRLCYPVALERKLNLEDYLFYLFRTSYKNKEAPNSREDGQDGIGNWPLFRIGDFRSHYRHHYGVFPLQKVCSIYYN